MPELPEVEVVRRGLAAAVTGREIDSVKVLHPRPIRRQVGGEPGFVAALEGRTFAEPRRRGKFLWLPLDNDSALVAHLGMSGQFRIDEADQELPPQCRVVLGFADAGPQLRFADQRMFGGLWVSADGPDGPPELAHIAPDLFDPALDLSSLARAVRRRRSGIKKVLLNQGVVSGIGNIYADEALWRARLHFETPADRLSLAKVRELLLAARDVMQEALAVGGTSFDALYVNVNGESGYFSRGLSAYGREDLPCFRCGSPILREPFEGRSSYRCPKCQRRPRIAS